MRQLNNSPPASPGQLLPSDRMILSYLQRLARAYGSDRVFPSVATIAQRVGVSDRTVQRALPRLARAGMIQIEPDASNKTGRRFLLPNGQPRAQSQVEPVASVAVVAAQVEPVPCHPMGRDAIVSPNDSSVSLQNQRRSSERQPQAQAGQPRVTTSLLPEQDRAVLHWFVERRQRAGKIGNAGAYLFSVGRQWASGGIPPDIASAYAEWERARGSRIAQEQRREQERIERLATGPEPPQPELGAMIRAMLPMRFRASLEAQEPFDGGNRRIIQGHGAIQAAVNVPC